MRATLLLYILFLLPCCLLAQRARQYAFKHFSTLNGLVSNSANAIAQDKDGYIWIATTHGLQRYDGNSFLTFKAADNKPKGLPTTNITTLYTDADNLLWIVGDNNSIGFFDTKKFEFTAIRIPKGLVPNPYQRFVELPSGELLLLSNGGKLYQYMAAQKSFVEAPHLLPQPKGWEFNHITWDNNIKKFWISSDSGLLQVDPATRRMAYRGHNPMNDPVVKAFENIRGLTDLTVNRQGIILGVVQEKSSIPPRLVQYLPQTRRIQSSELSHQLGVHHFHTDGFLLQDNGRIWLYGMPFLAEWQTAKNTFVPVIGGSKGHPNGYFNRIIQAYEDREKNIWVASDNGVLLFNPDMQVFSSYDLVRPGSPVRYDLVQGVAETGDGRILIGTWRGGLYCYDTNLNPIPLPPAYKTRGLTLSVADMGIHDNTGDIWITQEKGKIDVFRPKTNSVIEVEHPIFNGSTIRQFTNDTLGNIWLGTQGGRVIKWDSAKAGGDPRKGYELIYQTGIVRKIHYDYGGFIWVGTADRGLIKIDAATAKVVQVFNAEGSEGSRLFSNAVKDISYYNDSTLLVAAGCLNVIHKRTGKVTYIGTKEGLPSNTVESVQKDRYNTVWIGMTNGICRLNFEKKIVSYYDRRDGLIYDKFQQTGVQQLSDKRLIFFTDHNFMAFDPQQVSPRQLPPMPFITSFKLGGEPLSVDSLQQEKKIELRYTNNSFSIDFSAMSFLQQRKLHYYYMMRGVDNDWIHTDRPTEAGYNYLPPGDYTFYVKTETADGLSNGKMASMNIVILAPFWKTSWFYVLIALMLIGIWYLVDKERVNKRKSLLQVRNEIANSLHDDISLTLSDINVLSEIAKIKAGKNIEQSKDFIAKISEKSSNMIVAMDDMLWSINPANDSMKKTLDRIKELTYGLQVTYDTEIELMVDRKLEKQELGMKLRHDFFFLYNDAITFLVKHYATSQVFINMKLKKSGMLIEMISECPEDTRSFELEFKNTIAKRVQHLDATMNFSVQNKYVLAVFYIPLK